MKYLKVKDCRKKGCERYSMQKHYWQILINGEPWHNQKIWNYRSAIAVYKKVKSDLEKHIDYKGEIIELVRVEGKYAIVEEV